MASHLRHMPIMKMVIDETVQVAGLNLEVKEVNDTNEFISNNIMSIPAYKVNGSYQERGNQKFKSIF